MEVKTELKNVSLVVLHEMHFFFKGGTSERVTTWESNAIIHGYG